MPASPARRRDFGASAWRRHAGRHDAAQRFCVVRGLRRRRGAGQPGGADQLASEGRGGRLYPGRQRRRHAGLPRRPAAADHGRPARPYQAVGGNDAAGNRRRVQHRALAGAGPRGHDGLGQLARHPRAVAGAADRQRADVLHLGHHRPAQGRAPQADAARTARGLGARRRHRLWHQAERGPGHPDERPDVSFGAEFLRHAGVPQRLHDRARAALRSRGHAAADRAPSRHPHAHGADDVRAAVAAAG